MTIKIEKEIIGFDIAGQEDETPSPAEEDEVADIIQMHERVERPEMLEGSSYKIKTPMCEHALYVTINDMVLNYGTPHEHRRPFEIFINSKAMDHFQWIVALTRIMSAVFRKGGDVTFLVEELGAVFDPRGGYFKSGGVFMPSLVAEIGGVVETHLKKIGMIVDEELSDGHQALLVEKREEFEKRNSRCDEGSSSFPEGATLCNKCNTKAVIFMDGCNTCLSCGDSKCG